MEICKAKAILQDLKYAWIRWGNVSPDIKKEIKDNIEAVNIAIDALEKESNADLECNQCCERCYFAERFETNNIICINEKSDNCGEYVDKNCVCELWEVQNEFKK